MCSEAIEHEIDFVETHKGQRKPGSAKYRHAWKLILHPFVSKENYLELPVQFGEANFWSILEEKGSKKRGES